MRFGAQVLVLRGGNGPKPGEPGCLRYVRGVLVGRSGMESLVRLLDPDPLDTVGWHEAGAVGRWASSRIKARGKIANSPGPWVYLGARPPGSVGGTWEQYESRIVLGGLVDAMDAAEGGKP